MNLPRSTPGWHRWTLRLSLSPLAALAALAIIIPLGGCTTPGAATARPLDLQGHRGARGLAPENTLAAFDRALDIGVTTLELDTGLTADGVVVVTHDTTLNPEITRDAQGAWLPARGPAIRSLTLAQLQAYDVGRINPAAAYARTFAGQQARDGERIPTLAQVFQRVRERPGAGAVRFNIETKLDPTRPDETAPPEAMARALIAEIDRAGLRQRVTIQSFDWRTLVVVGQVAPDMSRAFLTTSRTLRDGRWTAGQRADAYGSVPRLVKAAAGSGAGPVVWSPVGSELDAGLVKEAQALGLQVIPWTINRREDMASLIDWGVDGLITDYPDVLRALIRERGLPLPPSTTR